MRIFLKSLLYLKRGAFGQSCNLLQRYLQEVIRRKVVYFGSPRCLVSEWLTYYPSIYIHNVQEIMELGSQVCLSPPTHSIMKYSTELSRLLPATLPQRTKNSPFSQRPSSWIPRLLWSSPTHSTPPHQTSYSGFSGGKPRPHLLHVTLTHTDHGHNSS